VRSLRGRTAVVTGAASGIGRALALRLGREGMNLVLADVDRRRLKEVAAALPGALAVATDVSKMADVERLAGEAYARFGKVHLLCNNAGIAAFGSVWELPIARWRSVLGVNLWGVIHGCVAFVPRMLAQGGQAHVVNTASMAGLVTAPSAGAYNASKHAVVALSETLVQDLALARAKIGVSVLCPGWVATRIVASERGPAAEVVRSLVEHGLSADTVADQTVKAIRQGQFYVLTHPEMAPAVRRRAEQILSGKAPATMALRARSRGG
jgi:NAD(P)-dependent dehydrogenase (short-subunit alcohol dehydrogenase family)